MDAGRFVWWLTISTGLLEGLNLIELGCAGRGSYGRALRGEEFRTKIWLQSPKSDILF
jgi:hypothetical protein